MICDWKPARPHELVCEVEEVIEDVHQHGLREDPVCLGLHLIFVFLNQVYCSCVSTVPPFDFVSISGLLLMCVNGVGVDSCIVVVVFHH